MLAEYTSRILILGTRVAGVYELHDVLQSALVDKGKAATSVDVIRFIDKIVPSITQPEAPPLRGVILFPEMRQKVGWYPRVVHVYEEEVDLAVKALCSQRNIPLFEMSNWQPDQGVRSLGKLLE